MPTPSSINATLRLAGKPVLTEERAARVADLIAAYVDGLNSINACDLDFADNGRSSRWRGLGVGNDFLAYRAAVRATSSMKAVA
jgi:hypothetical protein